MSGEHWTCVDCGDSFILSYEEQRYYRERHLELPKRCKRCRSRRRYEQQPVTRGFPSPPARTRLMPHLLPRRQLMLYCLATAQPPHTVA
jgi:hypothetical protein